MRSMLKVGSQLQIINGRNRALVNVRSFVSDSCIPQSPTTIDSSSITPATQNQNQLNLTRLSFPSSLKHPELAKFSAIADTWWDSEGPFKPLHALNPTRLAFTPSSLCPHLRKDPYSARPFEGLNIIDVGCGGGILSEAVGGCRWLVIQKMDGLPRRGQPLSCGPCRR